MSENVTYPFNKMNLRIGPKTTIPATLFNKRLAILAMQGAGKSYTAGVVEEEMEDYILKNQGTNVKFIVIDPVGAHWGLREKFPVHIIGGEHGDIELDTEAGHLFASMITEYNIPVIIDLSTQTQDDTLTFVAEFLDKIFSITKTPTHIILEEADMFAPQKMSNSLQKMTLSSVDSIVRRGRGRGLGVTMITQRPAVLNKNVLTQVDASLILNITGQTDLNTIREYLDSAGLKTKDIDDNIEKIMKFERGQALLFSPSWLKKTEVIGIRERISFHAGAEPEIDKPNPADKIVLIPMNITPLINYLNGSREQVAELPKDLNIRTNEWSKNAIASTTSNDNRKYVCPQHFKDKRELATGCLVLLGTILIGWFIISLFT